MKIAYDAKRITCNATGLGNYGRYIINMLSARYPQHEYHLFSPDKGKDNLRNRIKETPQIQFHYPANPTKFKKALWRTLGVTKEVKKEQATLFHGLSGELPINLKKNRIPAVVTIHDLIFLRYPRYYKWIDRQIYTFKFKKACRQADRIIAVSECTKQDIIRYFKINPEKIEVLYQGCDPAFAQPVSEEKKKEVKEKYQLPQTYILSVGSIEERKNLMLAVKAMNRVDENIHLIAIGKQTPYAEKIKKYIRTNKLEHRVTLLSNVPFDELPAIYRQARLFVYPSFFEGFGIPIIEALHSGIPVIAATGSCLEEAGGPATLYTNPADEKELSRKITAILQHPQTAREMIEKGKEYVKRFDEKHIARRLMAIYQEVSNKNSLMS